MLVKNCDRSDNFRVDPSVKTGSATLSDFKGSGYDRGHLCPAGDMSFSPIAMSESFFMSNMSPQSPSFNRGIWKSCEGIVRNWAKEEGRIYVVTGPIFGRSDKRIGPNQVLVPAYYYKAILDLSQPDQKAIALILPNRKCVGKPVDYVYSINELERMSGIDFFPQLADSLENLLESRSEASKWSWKSYKSPSAGNGKSTAVQCKSLTLDGDRCKRRTTNSSGYCWQHEEKRTDLRAPTREKKSSAYRCTATTQSGTRCKRRTKNRSGRCWQHE